MFKFKGLCRSRLQKVKSQYPQKMKFPQRFAPYREICVRRFARQVIRTNFRGIERVSIKEVSPTSIHLIDPGAR